MGQPHETPEDAPSTDAPSLPPPPYVVVDTSLTVKWLVREVDSDLAGERLLAWATEGTQLLAPDLIAAEVANALYKRVRRSELTIDAAHAALDQFLTLDIELVALSPLSQRALALAHHFRRDTPCDAHFLALAEREGCELWTADERLWNAVRHELSWVRWIGEAPMPPPSLPST